MTRARSLYLGAAVPPVGGSTAALELPPHHLATHGVVLGMTGSGKTGLLMVLVEEALRSRIPVVMIDVKGDLPNLLLAFPSFGAAEFSPWVEGQSDGPPEEGGAARLAAQLAEERGRQLQSWKLSEADAQQFRARSQLRVLTPGSSAGESLHILSSLERRAAVWDHDPDAGRATLSAAISLVLRLLGKDPDPAKSREHVLLSVLAERRLEQGHTAELGSLLDEVLRPPIAQIGALAVNDFLPLKERKSFAAALNTLLASPSFASWRQGASLDVRDWLTPRDGRTPAVIVSVAHLDDDERSLVLGRAARGSRRPRPVQRRLLGSRAPADRRRPRARRRQPGQRRRRRQLRRRHRQPRAPPWPALVSGAQRAREPNTVLLHPRWALSYLRGPMTPAEIRRALSLEGERGMRQVGGVGVAGGVSGVAGVAT